MDIHPAVSVLMPVYNAERYVMKAVESILNQTFLDFEFIIIDDGSHDNSLTILEKYAKEDNRIRLIISRENLGLVKTLNGGITLARAPLIARMDADDIAMPTRLELQTAFMNEHTDCVCLGGGIKVIDEKNRFLITADTKIGHENIELSALQGITPICHPTALIRKDALERVGGYQESDYPAEDLGLFLNLSEIGKLENLPDIVLQYRIHSSSISSSKHELQLKIMRAICERHWKKRSKTYEFLARVGRADESRDSKFDMTLKYGWWAFKSGEWTTALVYGVNSVFLNPCNLNSWRLFLCSLVKRQYD